jgi:hypothetical protein
MTWAVHVARFGEVKKAYRTFDGEGTRPLGRLSPLPEAAFKLKLKKGCVGVYV